MNVVIYQPLADDPTSGPITSCRSASEAALTDPRLPKVFFVPVDEARTNWDVTHKVVKGKVVPKAASVLKKENREMAEVRVRVERDQKLKDTDWTQGSDAVNVLSPERIAEFAVYRQALRDITDQQDLTEVVWPAEPGREG